MQALNEADLPIINAPTGTFGASCMLMTQVTICLAINQSRTEPFITLPYHEFAPLWLASDYIEDSPDDFLSSLRFTYQFGWHIIIDAGGNDDSFPLAIEDIISIFGQCDWKPFLLRRPAV